MTKKTREELIERLTSNERWLSDHWHLGKYVRRDCQANIDRDKELLRKLDAGEPDEDELPEWQDKPENAWFGVAADALRVGRVADALALIYKHAPPKIK